MKFVKNFTPPDFQAKNFTPSISPSFNSFSDKNTKKMSENGEIYTADKNFTLPPAVTALTNSTSGTRSNVITGGLHVRSIGWMLGNRIILGPIMTTIQEAGGQM